MMSNAIFALEELPKVQMPERLRKRTQESCNTLIGAKHDMISALFDLTEPKMASVSDAVIGERPRRAVLLLCAATCGRRGAAIA